MADNKAVVKPVTPALIVYQYFSFHSKGVAYPITTILVSAMFVLCVLVKRLPDLGKP